MKRQVIWDKNGYNVMYGNPTKQSNRQELEETFVQW